MAGASSRDAVGADQHRSRIGECWQVRCPWGGSKGHDRNTGWLAPFCCAEIIEEIFLYVDVLAAKYPEREHAAFTAVEPRTRNPRVAIGS